VKITDETVHQISRRQAVAKHRRVIEAMERVHNAPMPTIDIDYPTIRNIIQHGWEE
jgi:hypothetical protein